MKKILMLLLFVALCTIANAQGMEDAMNNRQSDFLISKTYSVGDIYNENGVKGLVVSTEDSGRHGLIMSLDSFKGKWTTLKKVDVNCDSDSDGEKNTEAVAQYISENGCLWSDFPLFEWCRNLGEGWYIPSKDEVEIIMVVLNGCIGEYDYNKWKEIDKLLKDNGGKGLIGNVKSPNSNMFNNKKMPYHLSSSTEVESNKVFFGTWLSVPFSDKIKIMEVKKTFGRYTGSRAVRKF